jgi:preprotein translocase subunit SecA
MDYLREGIHLRGFAQIDPLVAYKNEAFTLFQDLMNSIWSDFARMIYNVEVEVEGENGQREGAVPRQPAPGTATAATAFSYSGGTLEDQPTAYGAGGDGVGVEVEEEEPEPVQVVEQRRVDEHQQLGRNDPCWCGSGKKFKKCHGA